MDVDDDNGGGLASEDKVCESCGQIFSCEAAFLEHRKKKSCGSPCEVVIEALKGLRCPIKDCCMDFATYDALRIHHIDKHSSVDPYSKAKEEDIEKKRCGEESNNVGSTEVVLYGLKAGRTSQDCAETSRNVCEQKMPKKQLIKSERKENEGRKRGSDTERRKAAGSSESFRDEKLLRNTKTNRLLRIQEEYRKREEQKRKAKLWAKSTATARKRIEQQRSKRSELPGSKRAEQQRRIEVMRPLRTDHSAYCEPEKSSASVVRSAYGANQLLSTNYSTIRSLPGHEPSSVYSNLRSADREGLELFSEDDERDLQEEITKQCCQSEIPLMKLRASRMEKQCDTLFFMLRGLLQSTHLDEMFRKKYEEDLAIERLMETNPQITDFEARQMDALRAIAQSETLKAAQRNERKDAGADLHSSRRKEKLPSTPRPVDESDVATDRITIEQHATQYEQMRAHHAVAHSEPARRIEKKLTDAALDPHASRRKEQLPSTSRSDDELEVLINGRPIEHHEDNVERKRAAYASKNRRKWRGPKRRRIFRRPPIDSSDSLDLPLNKDPRVDEENAIILHPTLNRPLEKEEINIYIARTILRLKTDHITKSHIRMLAPGWMQIADDTDIMNAIEELRTSGLLVVKEDDKTRKQKVDVYKKAGSKDRVDIQSLLARYGVSLSEFEGGS